MTCTQRRKKKAREKRRRVVPFEKMTQQLKAHTLNDNSLFKR